MTLFECLIAAVFFIIGIVATSFVYLIPNMRLKSKVYKLQKQVYYWSRQMPMVKKRKSDKKKPK